MALRIDSIRSALARPRAQFAPGAQAARSAGGKTAFLCHSRLDADLAKGVVVLLGEAGWRVYVDWEDTEMPEQPNRQTAEILQRRIREMDFFLFLSTANSTASRWCPWEIGYANGTKLIDTILVIPTSDGAKTHGNEYLDLYLRLDMTTIGELVVRRPGLAGAAITLRNFA